MLSIIDTGFHMKLNKKALGLAVAVALASTSAFAVAPTGNNSQKGSLMIFPRIDVSKGVDTLITVANDFNDTGVTLKCYKIAPVTPGSKTGPKIIVDFSVDLTHNMPTYWYASHGGAGAPPFDLWPDGVSRTVGEMKCWAVSKKDLTEIHFNHLIGTASVMIGLGQAYEYTAWTFQAVEGTNTSDNTGKKLSTPGVLNLDNAEYDKCPARLLGTFFPGGQRFNHATMTDAEIDLGPQTQITIASCTEDLRQDRGNPQTKLTYTFWNEEESIRTGTHECMDSWYEKDLNKFPLATHASLQTEIAYMRIQPTASTVCPGSAVVGIVGVKSESLGIGFFTRGTNLSGRGEFTGEIKYDPIEKSVAPPPNIN